MINKELLLRCIDAIAALSSEDDVTLTLKNNKPINLTVYPKDWWTEDEVNRRRILSVLTPLVRSMNKEVDGTNIHYRGTIEGLEVQLRYAGSCKIVGYKKKTTYVQKKEVRIVEKEEEVETGETEEQEELVPITDCEIRMGKASESDIEVPA